MINSSLPLLLLAAILILTIGCKSPLYQDNNNEIVKINPDDKDKLRYLKEVEWPQAYREQDTILLDRLLGDDFKMIDAAGNWYGKKDELEWLRNNAVRNDSFYYEIKRFEILENGTAIICGTGHIFRDSTKTIYQSSNVLIKRDSIWKAVLSHVSGVKSAPD